MNPFKTEKHFGVISLEKLIYGSGYILELWDFLLEEVKEILGLVDKL